MTSGGTASVLRRKAERARSAPGEPRGAPEPRKALADAFRRACEEELSLAIAPGQPRERVATVAELLEGLPEHPFLAVLLGPEDGAGLFCLDAAALSAVIEMRTVGRVAARPPTPRRPTRTDAAMAADLIDRVLAEFEAPLLEADAARWAAGWRYQFPLDDPRPLGTVLEDASHRVLEIEIAFGGPDGKSGTAILAFPAAGRGRPRAPVPPDADTAQGAAAATWQRALHEAVDVAEAALDAVLGRVRLPLADLARLAPGDRIALPISALAAVRLVAPGGVAVAEGRLGQTGGARALRLAALDASPAQQSADGVVIEAGTLRSQAAPRAPDFESGGAFHPVGHAGPGTAAPGRHGLGPSDDRDSLDLDGLTGLDRLGGGAEDDFPGLPDLPGLAAVRRGAGRGDDTPA